MFPLHSVAYLCDSCSSFPNPLPLLVQNNQIKKVLSCWQKFRVLLARIFAKCFFRVFTQDLLSAGGNDYFRNSLQPLSKGIATLLWGKKKKIPFAPVRAHYFEGTMSLTKKILLFWGWSYETICCKLIAVGKERLTFTVNGFNALGSSCKDLPQSCLDWQDPFYKFEQLSSPVAAAKEI